MKNEKKLFLLLSALLGIVPFFWNLRGILVSEEFYAVDYVKWSKLVASSWVSYENFGWFGMWAPFRMQGYLIELIQLILGNYKIALLVWNTGLWVFTAIFFFLAMDALFQGRKSRFSIYLATVYYTFSPFFLNIHFLLSPPRLLFAAMPFFLWLLLKTGNVIYLAFFTVLFSSIFMNIPVGVVLGLFLGIIIFYYFSSKGFSWLQIIKQFLVFGVFFGVLHLWWIIPDGLRIADTVSNVKDAAARFSAVSSTHISDIFSLFGSWAFREKYNSRDYYFPYNSAYDNFPLVFLRFLPFVLLLYGIYIQIKNKERNYFFLISLISYLAFLILSKGTNGLFGFLYQFFLDYIPGFWMFREPYAKFTPALAFFASVLMVFGVDPLICTLKDKVRARVIAYLATVSIFVALVFPFFAVSDLVKTVVYNEPTYLTEFFTEWSPKSGNYLQMPSSGTNFQYKWDKLHSGNPYVLREDLKIIFRPSIYENPNIKNIAQYLFDIAMNDPSKFISQLGHFNISGIIYQNDNYATAQSEIHNLRKNYINYLSYTNQAATVYEFDNKITNFKLISKGKLIKTRHGHMEKYTEIREVTDPEEYLVFVDLPGVNRRLEKLTPEQFNFQKNSYSFSILADNTSTVNILSDSITSVNYNSKPIKVQKDTYLHKIPASTITNIRKPVPLEVTNRSDFKETVLSPWELLASDKNLNSGTSNQSDLVEQLFVKKLSYAVQPKHIYIEVADILSQENFKVGLYYGEIASKNFIEVDKKNYNPTIVNNRIILDFDTSTLDLSQFTNKNFYLFIKSVSPGVSKNIVETSIKYYVVDIPSVWLVTPATNDQHDYNFTETKINEFTYFLNVISPETLDDSILLLSQGYSKYWRLINVDNICVKDCTLRDTVKNYISILSKLKSGDKSINVEYIYNGWDLIGHTGQGYVAVFYPAFISTFLLQLQLIVLAFIAIVVIYAKLRRNLWH